MILVISNVETHKLVRDWKSVKELHTAKVIASGQGSARVVEMGSVHITFVSTLGPDPNDFIS